MFANLINPLAVAVTLSTAMGIFVHDARIDKMTSVALGVPAVAASYEPGSKVINFTNDFHTHVERTSVGHVGASLGTSDPSIKPRVSEDKKYLIQKHVMRGHYAFDNYNLPLV